MEEKSPKFFVQQSDGALRPATLPTWMVARAANYLELRKLGLTTEEIKLVLETNALSYA